MGGLAQPGQTRYHGPKRESTFRFGAHEVVVVRPSEPDRLLEAADVLAWNASDDYMPYWAYLWPGAFLLAEAIAQRVWSPGTTALEIGCGLGLAGLVAARAGLRVDFSDYDAAPFAFVRESLRRSGIVEPAARTFVMDWREPIDRRYDVVLGADVLYEERLVPMVGAVLRATLADEGVAVLAGPYRVSSQDIPERFRDFGLEVHETTINAQGETPDQHLSGTVWIARRLGVDRSG